MKFGYIGDVTPSVAANLAPPTTDHTGGKSTEELRAASRQRHRDERQAWNAGTRKLDEAFAETRRLDAARRRTTGPRHSVPGTAREASENVSREFRDALRSGVQRAPQHRWQELAEGANGEDLCIAFQAGMALAAINQIDKETSR